MTDAEPDMDDLLDEVLDAFDQQQRGAPPSNSNAAQPSSSQSFDPLGKKKAPKSKEPSKKQVTFDPLGQSQPARQAFDPLSQHRGRTPAAASLPDDDLDDLALPPDLQGLTQQLAGLMAEIAKEEGGDSLNGGEGHSDISATLQALAQQARSLQPGTGGGDEPAGPIPSSLFNDDMLSQLSQQCDGLGESPHMQSLVDSVMQQLLSKDVLYQPMKDIGVHYPAWLEKNRETLSAEDWERYNRQYGYIQQICKQYEDNPADFNSLVALLQQMQECGQPPQEIVEELAPGLEFDADGLPKLGGDSPLPAGLPPNMADCTIQ